MREWLTNVGTILFDLDGLLIDSERVSRECWFQVASEYGFDIAPIYNSLVGKGTSYCNSVLVEAFGPNFPISDVRQRKDTLMARRVQDGIPLKLAAKEILACAKDYGYLTGLVTGSDRRSTLKRIKPHKIESLFDDITCGDDVTRGKPSPDLYLRSSAMLGVQPCSCLAVEDSPVGIEAALHAGMKVIMIPDLLGPDLNISSQALILHSLSDLIQILDRISANTVKGLVSSLFD